MERSGFARPDRSYSPLQEGRDRLSEEVIGAAIEVHRALGPGMLESVYQVCLCEELRHRDLAHASEVTVPVTYRGRKLETNLRMDLLVNGELLVELKSIDRIAPVHLAQVLTYLRLADLRRGLLINFNVEKLTDGVRRVSLDTARRSWRLGV